MANPISQGNLPVQSAVLREFAGEISPDLRELSPVLRELFLSHPQHRNTGVASFVNLSNIFWKFKRLDACGCSEEVKEGVGKAILILKHPVVVFFDCISYLPGQIERIMYGGGGVTELLRTCKVALDWFASLTFAYGRPVMSAMFGDPTLDALFRLLDRAASCALTEKDEGFQWHWMWLELICVGASICLGEDMQQRYPAYNEHTCRILDYLSWLAHGRKDSGCPIKKVWESRHPEDLRRTSRLGASRLPSNGSPAHGVYDFESNPEWHPFSCQATKKFCRLARMFNLVFRQYILSITGMSWAVREVKTTDGIVRATLGATTKKDLGRRVVYPGISSNLDLSLPDVKAAHFAHFCCEIGCSAKPLLEYFFRASSRQIELMHFHPKNVHTPAWLSLGRDTLFNMTPTHTVAVITTESGLEFILDPTAAQYGWEETFAPRDIYTKWRVDCEFTTENVVPLDPTRPPTKETPKPKDEPERVIWEKARVAEYGLKKFKRWIPNGDLSRFIDLPEDRFVKECKDLEAYLGRKLGKYSKKRAKRLIKRPGNYR